MIKGQLETIVSIIKEAGEILKEGFGQTKQITYKSEIDLVTKYDVLCEQFLCERFSKIAPEFQIVAEESYKNEALKHKLIVIDPIDGTTNFVHNIPHVAISVAFLDTTGQDVGIVYNPILEELFIGIEGEGATWNGEKISVGKTEQLNKSLVATGFPYKIIEDEDIRKDVVSLLDKVLANVRGIRRLGSAALDLCYLSCGKFDLFYEYELKPWDVGAGIIILKESGGVALNGKGATYDIFKDTLLVASNKELIKNFAQLL